MFVCAVSFISITSNRQGGHISLGLKQHHELENPGEHEREREKERERERMNEIAQITFQTETRI